MTQPDFSGTFEGRFVDDDNLRESGRVWLEFDNGGGEMSLPIDPEATNIKNAALAAINDKGIGVLQDVNTAKDAAVAQVGTAGTSAINNISISGNVAVGAVDTARDSAVTAVNTAKSDALTDIEVDVTRAEDAADRAESAVIDGVADGAVTVAKLAPDVKAQINGKADLVGGKVPTSQIPDVASKKTFAVASSAAMMAVSAYAPVSSVNGQTGTVVLNAANVGAAPTTHTHTMAQITNLPTVTPSSTGDAIVQRWSTSQISVPTTPDADTAASSKAYVDLEAGKRVLKSGTATTLWAGTQAEYDALPAATRDAAGFIAVIV